MGFQQSQLGLYDSVAIYNIGRKATIDIYAEMKINSVMYTRQGCRKRNTRRIYFANNQNQENTKMIRKLLRGKRKGKNGKM